MTKLQICLLASEVAPFAKTGGLADVAAGLARYLGRAGHEVRLFMPMYPRVRAGDWRFAPIGELQDVTFELGPRQWTFSVSTAALPDSEVEVHFVQCPELFGREEIYSAAADEHLRFAVLTCAAIESCQRQQWAPDVFHCNDWHTALLPFYLQTRYSWDGLFASTKTLLTIHNIGYQGTFVADSLEGLGLDGERHLLHDADLAAGHVNFLRIGVRHADGVSTVSRTYAEEIQTPELGMGLEVDLRERRDVLRGIVNGVDYSEWDPATDVLLPVQYSPDDLDGKAANKRHLLEAFGLPAEGDLPLVGVVSRLTYQKGFELLAEVLPVFLQRGALRLAVLGTGEEKYESLFANLRQTYPELVGYYQGYNNELAHRIEAGADLFVMPSRYEPCGLNQMYSLKYGAVPIVRKTGGLADTVVPYGAAADSGTGFTFEGFTGQGLFDELRRALEVFYDREAWRRLMLRGMAVDWSWDVQGPEYVDLYRSL